MRRREGVHANLLREISMNIPRPPCANKESGMLPRERVGANLMAEISTNERTAPYTNKESGTLGIRSC